MISYSFTPQFPLNLPVGLTGSCSRIYSHFFHFPLYYSGHLSYNYKSLLISPHIPHSNSLTSQQPNGCFENVNQIKRFPALSTIMSFPCLKYNSIFLLLTTSLCVGHMLFCPPLPSTCVSCPECSQVCASIIPYTSTETDT